MEFLNLVIIFVTAILVWRRPDHERLAFGLLIVSILLMVFLFALATRSSLLPGVNY
jgi:high-affinity Fe2+/Pb2+ permease